MQNDNDEQQVPMPMTLVTGVVGEASVQLAMRSRGWTTDGACSLRHGQDMLAEHRVTGAKLAISVKSTTTGYVRFAKPGSSLTNWRAAAIRKGYTPVVAMVELLEPTTCTFTADLGGGSGWFIAQPAVAITALDAGIFAAAVDAERAKYSSQRYLIGKRKGEFKTESGLHYPFGVDVGAPLDEFLAPFEK